MLKNWFRFNKNEEQLVESKDEETQPNEMIIPAGHKAVSSEDKDQCPYFQIQQKLEQQREQNNEELSGLLSQDQSEQQEGEKKQKKPKGGCPFMPSEKKKNPGLGPLNEGYNLEFVSCFNYLLDYKGIDQFSNILGADENTLNNLAQKSPKKIAQKREKFDKYPIYLKHTLFQDEENMVKVRKCELSQRFFVYDQFREKGNKFFNKGQFQDAIICWERALGCIKWIELIDEEELEVQKLIEQKKLKEKTKFRDSTEGFNYIQSKIQQNQSLEADYQKVLLQRKNQQNQCPQVGLSDPDNLSLEEQNLKDNDAFFNDDQNENDDCQSQRTIRSDEAIDDDDDYFEREQQNLKEDVEQEIRDKELEDLMEDETLLDESETTVILDKQKDQEEKAKKRKQAEEIQKIRDEDRELKKKYKTLLTTYTDENTKLHDGENLTDSQDIDMRKSMLMAIYVNLSVGYMSLYHFSLARRVLDDALEISDKSSQVLYRKSQAIAYDKFSGLKELYQAKELIERAINLKNYEKLFNGEPGLLKMMNLANHKEAYIDQAHFVVNRIESLKQLYHTRIVEMLEREREIEEVYQDMLKNGDIPLDETNDQEMTLLELREEQDANMEIQVIKIMIEKYYDLIDFYQETTKPEKIDRVKSELQKLKEVYNDILFYQKLDFEKMPLNDLIASANKEYNIDFTNKRTLKRLLRLKRENIRELYESQQFNFTMFEYALKEYFKRKEAKQKKELQQTLKKEFKKQEAKTAEPARTFTRLIFNQENLSHLIILAIIVLTLLYFKQEKSSLPSLFKLK